MHLGDRGRGNGLRIELLERLRDGTSDLMSHRSLYHGPWLRRHAVLQLREALDVRGGEEIRTARGELGGFDQGPPQRCCRIEYASGSTPVLQLPILVP